MSVWSYITGWMQVFPFGRTQEEKEYILKTVLNHLPVVQGSEEDMYVHIIKAGGYNSSSSWDEYGYRTNNLLDKFHGEPRRSRHYGRMVTQDIYYLFIEANLRDVGYSTAYRQFAKWLIRFAKRIQVWSVDVVIQGTYEGEFARINSPSLLNLYVSPSWANEDEIKYAAHYPNYNKNWCEHLMWENKPPFQEDL